MIFTFVINLTVQAQRPVVTAVDKVSGGLDDIVTIKGSSFGTNAANLRVFFGAEKGTIVSITDQLLEVKVPAGTTYQHISVTNVTNKLTGYSHDPFLLSFGGSYPFLASNLGTEQHFQSENELYDHCLCDLNADGLVDIATANRSSTNIAVFTNTSTVAGAINFSARKLINVNATTLQIKCGDLNGDGLPDLVASEGTIGANNTRVFILQNLGGMNFSVQSVTFTNHKVSKLEIADLDGDGLPEVLVGDQFVSDPTNPNKPAQIGVLINNSNGPITFSGSMTITIPKGTSPDPAFQSTDAIVAQDLNGDGLPEIITSQYGSSTSNIAIIPNNSVPGSIIFGTAIKLSKVNDAIRDIRVGDLDGDNKPDIAFTGVSAGRVNIFLNTGSGSTINFAANPVPFIATLGMWGIDLGDIDGDSKTDILASNVQSKYFLILNNKSTPGNLAFDALQITTEFVNRHVRIGDLNADGKPDVSISSVDRVGVPASKVSVFPNNSCPVAKISPATSPISLCSGFLATNPYTLTAPVFKNAWYQWMKDGVPLTDVNACGQNKNTYNLTSTHTSGKYSVKVISGTGATSCGAAASCVTESDPIDVTIVTSGAVSVTATASPNTAICVGDNLTLGVTPVIAGVTYRWKGPDGFTSTVATPVVSNFQQKNVGTYEVEVTVTAGGCVAAIESVDVTANAVESFQITPAGSVVICQGDPGKLLSVVPALPATYDYQWKKDGTALGGQTATTYTVPSLTTATGSYTVEAKPKACITKSNTAPVQVTVTATPVASFTFSPGTACANQLVHFTAVSTPGANYLWDFKDTKTSTEQNPDHLFATANTYNVTLQVSFNGACPASVSNDITITTSPPIAITTDAPDYTICDGETITLTLDNSFASPVWSNGSTAYSITVSEGGVYTVTATKDGCTLTDESDPVIKLPKPGVIVTADPQQIDEGGSTQLNATGLDNYEWTPEESLSDPDIENPVATPLVTTSYTVTGTDGSGCTGSATIQITVRGEAVVNKLNPKNFFSPNNSGHNDLWAIDNILDFPQCEVTIYDDKGVKVFSAKPYQNDWGGTYNGRDLPDGVYYFVIRCDGEENSPRTGSITLIR